ncbi:MAG: SPOR domain-containing protein, partial [Cyclobacteriaceae bacterium]|nr:SPOR domain-containing protein [Cyclobacteriaceae bacterium]
YRILILFAILAYGCRTTQLSTSVPAYDEDLSVHRPADTPATITDPARSTNTPVSFKSHLAHELDSINRIIDQQNQHKLVDGYTIQVYRGNSRYAAEMARDTLYQLYPSLHPELNYYQPTYRVKAGRFVDRLEANRVYESLKYYFPQALLLPEKIRITSNGN